jgi:glycosyltransferase involved in cell wall biosynthesis
MTEPARVVVLGMSTTQICGVRDHAELLAEGLRAEGLSCSVYWLYRSQESLRGSRAEVGGWVAGLSRVLAEERPELLILHYSVFAFGFRGVPVFVPRLIRALRHSRVPVLTIIHEAVYPWSIGGARGKVWAASQRAVLAGVVRASSAILVTADFRAQWLTSRRWLATRPIAFAPVFSNLPAPSEGARAGAPGDLIGLFGYSYEGAGVALVLDALRILGERGIGARLLLLGAPGPSSAAARTWVAAAKERGLESSLSLSGTLPAQELVDAMAGCDLLLVVNDGGPSSRKGTLGGSLASGSPVVAMDGPRRWSELIDGRMIRISGRTAEALADAAAELLADRDLREALGRRGRQFAEDRMGVPRTARAVVELARGLGLPR